MGFYGSSRKGIKKSPEKWEIFYLSVNVTLFSGFDFPIKPPSEMREDSSTKK